jgi:HD-GYP domain-containing protein (c-di-GMP phosphodiesterase class II)
MTLALPVRHPDNRRQVLLHAGFELTTEVIRRLQGMNIRDVLVQYPGLEALDQYINPEVIARRGELMQNLEVTFRNMQRDASANIPYEQYLSQVGELVEKVLSNPASLLFIDEATDCQPGLLEHATAVSYLSLLIALKIDAYIMKQRRALPPRHARALGNLGVGAMLHDVGLLKLEPHIRVRFEETGNMDDPAWRAHTRIGYELVRGQVEPTAAVIVLDHHQRFDGSGFPARRNLQGKAVPLVGERIHVFARIVAAADTYHDLRYAGAVPTPGVRVLKQMISEKMIGWFDPHVLRALLLVVPPFPPLSPVQLNDGRWAVPLEHSPAHPCEPRVQILTNFTEAGGFSPAALGDAEQIDLSETDLRIARAEGQKVLDDFFELPDFDKLEANVPTASVMV